MANIQIRSRLVEHDDFGLLTDGAGEQDPLALTVADSVERSVGEMPGMHSGQRPVHLLFVRIREDSETAGIGVAAHGGHVPAGHEFCLQTAGQHDSHISGQVRRGKLIQVFRRQASLFGQKNISANRNELAGDGLEDRGLAGSVRTDQGHDLPPLHAYLNAADQGLSVITDDQAVEL